MLNNWLIIKPQDIKQGKQVPFKKIIYLRLSPFLKSFASKKLIPLHSQPPLQLVYPTSCPDDLLTFTREYHTKQLNPVLCFCFVFILFFPLGFPCRQCPPGSFNNESRAETCQCCADGYASTSMKTSCRPCPANEWSRHGSFPNCSLCQTCFTSEDCKCVS